MEKGFIKVLTIECKKGEKKRGYNYFMSDIDKRGKLAENPFSPLFAENGEKRGAGGQGHEGSIFCSSPP